MELPYLITIILRLSAPLLILKYPFWGYATAIGFDAIDLEILESSAKYLMTNFSVDYTRYQLSDKILDTYMNSLALFMSFSWPEKIAQRSAAVLFGYRSIGVLSFIITGNLVFLVVFFNLFELFYLFYAYMQKYKTDFRIDKVKRLLVILGILCVLQFIREYYLHITDERLWGTIRDKLLE